MKRHIVASGATALALCLGAGGALAADPVAPVGLAVPVAPQQPPEEPALLKLLAALLGIEAPPPGVTATAGAVTAAASGSQTVVNEQAVPVAGAVAVSSPSHVNVPVGVAGGPGAAGGGTVHQNSTSQAAAAAANDLSTQSVTPGPGDGAGGAASQSSASGQVVPVAVGAAISAPVNLNAPIGVLSARPAGNVTQTADSAAQAAALTNHVQQAIRSGSAGGAATQSADGSQAVPIALGLAVAAPINVNLPIDLLDGDGVDLLGGPLDGTLGDVLRGILSLGGEPGAVGGTVTQQSTSQATGIAVNNVVEQSVAAGEGGTAAQSATSDQLVPAAVGAAVSLPLNGNLPVGVLQDADGADGGPVEQSNAAAASAEAVNLDLNQDVQQGGAGEATDAQSSENGQLVPIAIATDLAVPINLHVPVSLFGRPLLGDGDVDLSIVQRALDAVDATLADPLGTLRHALLEDPEGTIEGLLAG